VHPEFHPEKNMRLVKRILLGAAALLVVGITSLAVLLSYEAPCGEPESVTQEASSVRAIVHRCYGSAEVLKVERVPKPVATEGRLLIKVVAASVNPVDWHSMTGKPYVMRLSSGFGTPKSIQRGVDFAGVVEALGPNVSEFKVGDEVFGAHGGAFAEYISVSANGSIALKPQNLSFEQAATLPVAAVTALQGLRDHGKVGPGTKVLINGASGGVGTFAVQIAKALGAEVTGVCSTRNVEMVRAIGADHVIDYTQRNFTEAAERYDVVLDNVGNHGLLEVRQILKPRGRLVIVGGPKADPWLGPVAAPLKAMLLSPFIDEHMAMFIAQVSAEDLNVLAELARSGKIVPTIDRRYALADVADAMRYLATQRARGKVVIEINETAGARYLSGV
jgi:NADPH:quinone reductase-like Zn-dependent oxidoreductase